MTRLFDKFFWFLLFIILCKAVFAFRIISLEMIPLGPDEAQYWTWSKILALGYYSKPPAIAWQIFLGTSIFGDTETGVRFLAVIFGSLLPFAVYLLACRCKLKKSTCFFAGLVMAFSPLGILSSLLATTDGGMVFFWTVAVVVIANALSKNAPPNYFLLAMSIFCGGLFKWPIFLLWIPIFLLKFFNPNWRSIKLLYGFLFSLCALLPTIAWNSSHEWVTFRHVYATIQGGSQNSVKAPFRFHGNFFEFLGAEMALLSPLFFVFLLFSFAALFRKRKSVSKSLLFCGWLTFGILFFYASASIFQKIQGNWCIFAYPTAIVCLVWFSQETFRLSSLWLFLGLGFSCTLSGFSLSIPYLQQHSLLSLPYKWNPFRHNIGWHALKSTLQESGYDPKVHFLFSDKYQMTSILSFYAPEQNRAYFFNLQGMRKNQFSYWPSMAEEQAGKSGFFVISENEPHLSSAMNQQSLLYGRVLQQYFKKVTYLGMRPLFFANGKLAKGALIYFCEDFNGKMPKDPELY